VIEWVGQAPHPAGDYQGIRGLERAVQRGELGLAEFRRRHINGGWQLEQDVAFPFEGVRLMAVECLSAKSPRLVWRELTPAGGRTMFAEWTADSEQLKVIQWEQDGSLRQTLDAQSGALMPQYLLELVRSENVSGGDFVVFNPLLAGFEECTLELRFTPGAEWGRGPADEELPRPLREATVRRADGSLLGRYRFAGTQLIELRWQTGAMRLRRISAEAYAERWQAWGLGDPAEEASAPVKEM